MSEGRIREAEKSDPSEQTVSLTCLLLQGKQQLATEDLLCVRKYLMCNPHSNIHLRAHGGAGYEF